MAHCEPRPIDTIRGFCDWRVLPRDDVLVPENIGADLATTMFYVGHCFFSLVVPEFSYVSPACSTPYHRKAY